MVREKDESNSSLLVKLLQQNPIHFADFSALVQQAHLMS